MLFEGYIQLLARHIVQHVVRLAQILNAEHWVVEVFLIHASQFFISLQLIQRNRLMMSAIRSFGNIMHRSTSVGFQTVGNIDLLLLACHWEERWLSFKHRNGSLIGRCSINLGLVFNSNIFVIVD